jgi:hypothetical protein
MAPKKRNIYQDAKDVLAQGIISVRNLGAFFRSVSRDKRTIKSTKRAARELFAERSDKEVAAQLGISRQKATALKQKIREGKAYGPELRDLLKETAAEPIPRPARAKEPEGFYIPKPTDKRTVKSTQRAARELFADRTDKEVAAQLGISRQKATALKQKIAAGKAYGPELRDQLQNANRDYIATPQQMSEGVYYFPEMSKLKKTTHVDIIKPFTFLEDALQWWKTIVKSGTYLAITQKNGMYYVVGLGKRSQRPQKGKIQERGAGNRVKQLLSKYREEEEDFDFEEEEEEE